MQMKARRARFMLNGDKIIWVVLILLALISLVEVYSAIGNEAYNDNKSTTELFFKHALTLAFSFFAIYMFSHISYTHIARIITPMLVISTVLLVIALVLHKRWIPIPGFGTFQPSEMAKYILICYVSRELTLMSEKVKTKEAFVRILIPVILVCALIIPQSASAAGITFLSCFLLMLVAGINGKYLWGLGFSIVLFVIVSFYLVSKVPQQMQKISGMSRIVEGYERVFPKELNIQVKNARLAIGTAGFIGKGLGNSQLANFQPEAHNDYIYSVILEEGGFLFGFIVMLLYMILLYRCFAIAKKTKGLFGAFVAIGIGLILIIQSLINMFVGSGFKIVTGQTLPLISKGGTSYLFACIALGIVLNISAQREKKDTYENDMEEAEETAHAIETQTQENQ
jgi:cell division protein FtsW